MPAESPAELPAESPAPVYPRFSMVVRWLEDHAPSPRTMTISALAAILLSIITLYIYFFYYIFLVMNKRSQGQLMSSTNRTQNI